MSDLGALYQTDYAAWAKRHVELRRARRFGELDIEHLLDELSDMSKNERRELKSRLLILMRLPPPPSPSHAGEGGFSNSLFGMAPSPLVGEGWGGGLGRRPRVRAYLQTLGLERYRAWVFGSVGRGDFTKESDTDVLIVSDDLPEDRRQRLDLIFDARDVAPEIEPVDWLERERDEREARGDPFLAILRREAIAVDPKPTSGHD